MKFLKIVKFLDGTYGVREGLHNFKFYEDGEATWDLRFSKEYCHHTLEKARKIYEEIKSRKRTLKDVGTPIKEE